MSAFEVGSSEAIYKTLVISGLTTALMRIRIFLESRV